MNENEIIINVDGKSYSGFDEVYVSRSLDTAAGTFRISTVIENVKNYPIKLGQSCQIFVNGTQTIQGYIEKLEIEYSAAAGSVNHKLTASGRDNTSDLIDSTLDGQMTFSGQSTLENVIKTTMSKLGILGIGIVNKAGKIAPFDQNYIASGSVGQGAFEFLESLARLRDVLLTSDGKGNIVIAKASNHDSNACLVNSIEERNKSNIIDAQMIYDDSQRYNQYKVFSQEQSTVQFEETSPEQSVNINQIATDAGIRKGRVYNFIAENNSSNGECKNRAIWERNARMAPAKIYTATVYGFNKDAKSIWDTNILVKIIDEFADIKSTMLINNVEFSQSIRGGSKTKITCIDKDAFTANLELSKAQQNSRLEGQNLGARFQEAKNA